MSGQFDGNDQNYVFDIKEGTWARFDIEAAYPGSQIFEDREEYLLGVNTALLSMPAPVNQSEKGKLLLIECPLSEEVLKTLKGMCNIDPTEILNELWQDFDKDRDDISQEANHNMVNKRGFLRQGLISLRARLDRSDQEPPTLLDVLTAFFPIQGELFQHIAEAARDTEAEYQRLVERVDQLRGRVDFLNKIGKKYSKDTEREEFEKDLTFAKIPAEQAEKQLFRKHRGYQQASSQISRAMTEDCSKIRFWNNFYSDEAAAKKQWSKVREIIDGKTQFPPLDQSQFFKRN